MFPIQDNSTVTNLHSISTSPRAADNVQPLAGYLSQLALHVYRASRRRAAHLHSCTAPPSFRKQGLCTGRSEPGSKPAMCVPGEWPGTRLAQHTYGRLTVPRTFVSSSESDAVSEMEDRRLVCPRKARLREDWKRGGLRAFVRLLLRGSLPLSDAGWESSPFRSSVPLGTEEPRAFRRFRCDECRAFGVGRGPVF